MLVYLFWAALLLNIWNGIKLFLGMPPAILKAQIHFYDLVATGFIYGLTMTKYRTYAPLLMGPVVLGRVVLIILALHSLLPFGEIDIEYASEFKLMIPSTVICIMLAVPIHYLFLALFYMPLFFAGMSF